MITIAKKVMMYASWQSRNLATHLCRRLL